MKRFAALCAFMLVAASALAQTPVQPVGPPSGDSPVKYKQVVNSAGAASVLEASPAYSTWAQEVVFSDTLSTNGRTTDSTATAFDTANYHTLTFYFQTVTTAAVDSVMYIELQIRPCTIAAGLGDSSGVYHMEKVIGRTTVYAAGAAARDTIGHPVAAVATFNKEAPADGAGSVLPTAGHSIILRLRADPAFASMGPGNSPKGFAITVKDWYSSHCQLWFKVLNKVASPPAAAYRRCQFVVTVEKSAL